MWAHATEVKKLSPADINTFLTDPGKKNGKLKAGYRIAQNPSQWEAEQKTKETRDVADQQEGQDTDMPAAGSPATRLQSVLGLQFGARSSASSQNSTSTRTISPQHSRYNTSPVSSTSQLPTLTSANTQGAPTSTPERKAEASSLYYSPPKRLAPQPSSSQEVAPQASTSAIIAGESMFVSPETPVAGVRQDTRPDATEVYAQRPQDFASSSDEASSDELPDLKEVMSQRASQARARRSEKASQSPNRGSGTPLKQEAKGIRVKAEELEKGTRWETEEQGRAKSPPSVPQSETADDSRQYCE